ncbi:MAG: ATP-binding protein, partial [Okeania sp. SIO2H7]|nr:ATP-binding protein [Okeania sp. SIO2H7]
MLYGCLMQEDPPTSRKCLEEVIMERRNQIATVIDNNEWELLRQVGERKTIAGE